MDKSKYFDANGMLQPDVQHPEDIAAELSEEDFAKLYDLVLAEYTSTTEKNSALFAQAGSIEQQQRLATLLLPYESRVESWLNCAIEHLAERYVGDLGQIEE